MGRIAAGNPIEAITGSFEQISVPNYLINNKEEHYTLEVNGDSMIDEGIFDGDIVIICKTNFAQTGDIVVALIDENEVTNEASFTNDLGADSLDTVELIMEFEKEFDIQIPDDQAENISTVGQAISYIENS